MVAVRGAKVLSTLLFERKQMSHPYSASRKRGHSAIASSDDADSWTKRRLVELSGVLQSLAANTHESTYQTNVSHASRAPSEEIEAEQDLTYKRFTELFPPQAGFSNSFLFGTLLEFSHV